jgi:hypothetical protein
VHWRCNAGCVAASRMKLVHVCSSKAAGPPAFSEGRAGPEVKTPNMGGGELTLKRSEDDDRAHSRNPCSHPTCASAHNHSLKASLEPAANLHNPLFRPCVVCHVPRTGRAYRRIAGMASLWAWHL